MSSRHDRPCTVASPHGQHQTAHPATGKPTLGRSCSIMAAMGAPAAPPRVVLADDDVLLREGLASLLERGGFQVVGQSGNARDLLELVGEHNPDLAIVDIRMPPTHATEGLDAARL